MSAGRVPASGVNESHHDDPTSTTSGGIANALVARPMTGRLVAAWEASSLPRVLNRRTTLGLEGCWTPAWSTESRSRRDRHHQGWDRHLCEAQSAAF
jgi:hypothetical protein